MVNNIGLVCGSCKAQHRADTQALIAKHNLQPNDLIGCHVQLAFDIPGEEERKENMWVLVLELDDVEDLRGQLDNKPVLSPWAD